MADFTDPRLGQTVEGRYRIESLIANGGMASVYLASDARLERHVALKLIHQQLASGTHRDQFLRRFHIEATSAAKIADPHIVQVYDTGTTDGLPYLVMEYVRGVDLRHRLSQEGTLSVRETLRILSEVLQGIAAAHQEGIIHRDIKPENILLTSRGHVKITDFGLAKALDQNSTGTTGLLLGTAAYLAPETIEASTSTAASDIYAIGIMGYEMLAGRVPFASSNAVTTVFRHVNSDIPPLGTVDPAFCGALSTLIGRLCARDPAQRPANGSQALDLLRQTAGVLPGSLLDHRHVPSSSASMTPAPLHSVRPVVHRTRPSATAIQPAASAAGQAQADQTRKVARPSAQRSPQRAIPTQVVPPSAAAETTALASSAPAAMAAASHKKRAGIIVGSILAALALIALGVWWWFLGPGSTYTIPKANDVRCSESVCSLRGADWATYRHGLREDGIPYASTEAYSDTVASGRILSSSLKGGESMSKRVGRLAVTVSKGQRRVTIPANLLDCSEYPDAERYLKDRGLTRLTIDREWSLSVKSGCVISSSARPGTTIGHASAVTVTISRGRKPVTIPDVEGLSADEAEQRLRQLRLSVTTAEDFSDTIAKGAVLSIRPQAGSKAHWGDKVTLTISKGPQTVTMPNLVGASKSSAREQLERMGFKVETKSSPIGELLHQVFSQSVQAGSQVRLRDSSGKPTVITLTCV